MHVRIFAQSGYHWLISGEIEVSIISTKVILTCSFGACTVWVMYCTNKIYHMFLVHIRRSLDTANTLCIIFIMKTTQGLQYNIIIIIKIL